MRSKGGEAIPRSGSDVSATRAQPDTGVLFRRYATRSTTAHRDPCGGAEAAK